MGIFLETGYLDMNYVYKRKYPFIMVVGGRGTGKTYGALERNVTHETMQMLLRRTQTQVDTISKAEFNPYKQIAENRGLFIDVHRISKYNSEFYLSDFDGNKIKTLSYTGALSTFANIRGFDGNEIDEMLFDEFIPEAHERLIKHEVDAFFNAYETINRNRELNGRPPLKCVMLSNSNDLFNPYFIQLHVADKLCRLISRNPDKDYYEVTFDDIGLLVIYIVKSPISEKKKNTALYQLTQGSDFSAMAIDNKFIANADSHDIKNQRLSEYIPLVKFNDVVFYRNKNNSCYYACNRAIGKPKDVTFSNFPKSDIITIFPIMYEHYRSGRMIYQSYDIKAKVKHLFTELK